MLISTDQQTRARQPLKLGMIEVHDCFFITEMVTMEDLQISPPGKKPNDFLNGFYDLCGHSIGTSGLRMLYDVYNQLLRLWPEERLVKNPKMGLTHNLGGVPSQNFCSISILGLD